jgi:hypothetical protein
MGWIEWNPFVCALQLVCLLCASVIVPFSVYKDMGQRRIDILIAMIWTQVTCEEKHVDEYINEAVYLAGSVISSLDPSFMNLV